MIEATCPNCGERSGADKSAIGSEMICGICNTPFVFQPDSVLPTLAEKQAKVRSFVAKRRERNKRKNGIGGVIIFWGIILALFLPLVGVMVWQKSMHNEWDAEKKAREDRVAKWRADNPEQAKLADEEAKQPKRRVNGDQIGAWVAIQGAVEQRLKSPSSAKFPFGGHRSVTLLGGDRYSVRSYVEAQNAFGATVRTNFSGIVVSTGNGWRVESLSLDQ